jgi:hypothetical protein
MTNAAEIAAIRALLPTTLGSAELRDALAADIRARAVFSARVSDATVLDAIRRVTVAVAAGDMDDATARWLILESVRATGYTPEEGFPDAPPGEVPEAVRGSLRDLTSLRRLNLIVRTQADLCRGRGQQIRGMGRERLAAFPAWELVRVQSSRMPRAWGGQHSGTPPLRGGTPDLRPRWIIAGGRSIPGGRLIALKADPLWGELGSSGNFDDALDVDYPPFAFHSGMGRREVSAATCRDLKITGPDGQTPEQWLAEDHPLLVGGQAGLPAPQASVRNLDPALARTLAKMPGMAAAGESDLTTQAGRDEVLRTLDERRAAREARRAQRLRASIATRRADYEGRDL